jgi:hypothetical protein
MLVQPWDVSPPASALNRSSMGPVRSSMKPNSILLLAALSLVGCVKSHQTVVSQSSRISVSFQNDSASRIFQKALSRHPVLEESEESKTVFSIPFVFDYKRTVVRGPAQAFNEAVLRCDTNHDGKISEREARAFADSPSE